MPGPSDAGIASAFFLIASLCVGIPTFIWALRTLYRWRKNGGRTTFFMPFLLLNVLLQSAFTPPVIRESLRDYCSSRACFWTVILFKTTDVCGIYLHQLVALESILSLRHPLYTADLFSRPCSAMLCIGLYAPAFMCVATRSHFAFTLLSTAILIVMYIFIFKDPPSSHHVPNTHRKLKYWVLAVVMVTMIAFYLPYLLVYFITYSDYYIKLYDKRDVNKYLAAIDVTFSMRSLRVITDSLLCVLVCKKILPIHLEQMPTEPSASHDLPLNDMKSDT